MPRESYGKQNKSCLEKNKTYLSTSSSESSLDSEKNKKKHKKKTPKKNTKKKHREELVPAPTQIDYHPSSWRRGFWISLITLWKHQNWPSFSQELAEESLQHPRSTKSQPTKTARRKLLQKGCLTSKRVGEYVFLDGLSLQKQALRSIPPTKPMAKASLRIIKYYNTLHKVEGQKYYCIQFYYIINLCSS